jgi:hypothetical protein
MNKKIRLTWQRLTADRRRFGLFCTLLFVGLLLWARIIVIARPPRTAVAEPAIEATAMSLTALDTVAIPVLLETHPKKNPFVISVQAFPNTLSTTDNIRPQYADSTIKAEQEIVASLTLEAIMGKMAMINGRVIQQGEVVVIQNVPDPLRLTGLSGRSVIISAGDRRYELTIASPRR